MNKKFILIITISILLLCLFGLGIYYSPFYKNWKELKTSEQVKELNSVFLQKVLDEHAKDENQKILDVAQKVADELNEKSINPFNKKAKLYVFDTSCKEQSAIVVDEKMSMLTLTTCDKNEEIYARLVIMPPSFVKYFKADN